MLDATHLTTPSPTTAVIAARILTPVVRSCQWLFINVKQAHWSMRGVNFIAGDELLDTVATHARDGADEAAERIVSLGLPLDARLAIIADNSQPTAVAAAFSAWDDSIRAVSRTRTRFSPTSTAPSRGWTAPTWSVKTSSSA